MPSNVIEAQVVAATAGVLLPDLDSFSSQRIEDKSINPLALEWIRDDTEITFNELAAEWRQQRSGASSFSGANASIPAYQFIIGMGPRVLPYILRELAKFEEDWYWALKAISREDPVPTEHRGKRRIMRALWLQWGRAKRYVR